MINAINIRIRLLLSILQPGLTKSVKKILEQEDRASGQWGQIQDIKASSNPISFLSQIDLSQDRLINFNEIINFFNSQTLKQENYFSEPDVAEFMALLSLKCKAKLIVELGAHHGFTTLHIAKALRDSNSEARITCLDADSDNLKALRSNLSSCRLEKYVGDILHGFSTDPVIVNKIPDRIDLLYIDTSHTEEDTIKEIQLYQNKISKNGILVFHDAIKWPGVRTAIQSLSVNWKTMIFATSKGNGICAAQRIQ